jgi:hypothetical protein
MVGLKLRQIDVMVAGAKAGDRFFFACQCSHFLLHVFPWLTIVQIPVTLVKCRIDITVRRMGKMKVGLIDQCIHIDR